MSKQRIRLMHIVFSLETGGLENGVVNLCNRLDPERFHSSVCVYQNGGALESRLEQDRVALLFVPRLRSNDPSLPLRLAWQLRRHKVDILHTHSWGTLVEGVIAGKLSKVPVVVHGEHGVMETRPRNLVVQRALWSRVQQVTAVADELADRMAATVGFPRKRIVTIPNGVDTERFHPRPDHRQRWRQQFKLPQDAFVIGTVARLVSVKNHAGLIQAVARLNTMGISVFLALAGEGPLRSELQQAAHNLEIADRVRFLGDVSQVDSFLNALDVFALNSHSEGMSNTVLEAMSSGLPVVATSVGSNPNLISNGESGLLVNANDVADLTRALAKLATDHSLRKSLALAARRRIEEQFSIDSMVRAYEQLYLRLAQEHAGLTLNVPSTACDGSLSCLRR